MYGIHRKGIHLSYIERPVDSSLERIPMPNYTSYDLGNLETFITGSVSEDGEVAAVVYHKGDTQRDKEGNKMEAGYYVRFFKPQVKRTSADYHTSRTGHLTLLRAAKIEFDFNTGLYYSLKTMTSDPTHIHLGKITKPSSENLLREEVSNRVVSLIGSDGNADYPNFNHLHIQHRPKIVKENMVTIVFGKDRIIANETPWRFTQTANKHPAYPSNKGGNAIDIRWSAPLSMGGLFQLMTDRRGGLFLFGVYE